MNYKERQETMVKEFDITDVNGQVHKAIIVGILTVEKWDGQDIKRKSFTSKNKTVITETVTKTTCYNKEFAIGLSIANPTDAYNYDMGLQIATGRAEKETKRLGLVISEDRTMLGPLMCEAIIEQQIEYICENQGHFLVVKPLLTMGSVQGTSGTSSVTTTNIENPTSISISTAQ